MQIYQKINAVQQIRIARLGLILSPIQEKYSQFKAFGR